MGLAPYANKKESEKITNLFADYMWVEGLRVKSKLNIMHYYAFIEKHLAKVRFDLVAAGIQKFTERTLVTLVRNALKVVKTDTVIMGGGVMMNVKANMEITKIPKIKNFYVVPSCSDESTAIGAAYYGYKEYCLTENLSFDPKPMKHVYLGPSYLDREIQKAINLQAKKKYFTFGKLHNPAKEIAKLLAEGKIVARFAGRMEYGARSLGNRSILANPSKYEVIKIINEQIKSRDFWMPFAPTILYERADDYIKNPKHLDAPFMMIAFETTILAREHLKAAIHQYDFTVRPQILSRWENPSYYEIIREFEGLTGIGAVLNTSFNIHGEPIVCSPDDALSTFFRSGLQYLALGDYLLSKNHI